jgi:hypothetical protein
LVGYDRRVRQLRKDVLELRDHLIQSLEHLLLGACPHASPPIAALEALNTTTGVYEFLLAREERVALVAKLGMQFGFGRAGRKGVAT